MLFYNEKRPHAQNGYKTPLRKETEYRERQKWHTPQRQFADISLFNADFTYIKSDYVV